MAGNGDCGARNDARGIIKVELLSDEARPVDPGAAARVLRKIDLFLMPAMTIGTRDTVRLCPLTKTDREDRLWPGVL